MNWQFWIDVGGTFTDCIGVDPNGDKHFTKVLSSGQILGSAEPDANGYLFSNELIGFKNQFFRDLEIRFNQESCRIMDSQSDGRIRLDQGEESVDATTHFTIESKLPAPIFAIRKTLNLPLIQPLPNLDVRLGTTRGTNALLTRTGARVAFVTTKGHGDLLRIGFQNRPDIFAIDIKKPEPLFELSVEIDERILHDGTVEKQLDPDAARTQLLQIKKQGIDSLAICLMHSFKFPAHEILLESIAREVGFEEISVSHRVAPAIRIIPRAYTTVLDAYLNPILRSYVNQIRKHLTVDSALALFSSSGALVPADQFTGKDSILSGPAGGVVGFSKTAQTAGITKSIGFDMGGTSTDVSRFDGEYHYHYEVEKSGVFIVAPTLAIETIAAGGGSVCEYDGKRFLIGPKSAGANPGPACYGKGGPLCITDINLFLGRIKKDSFPFPLDLAAVETKLKQIQHQIKQSEKQDRSLIWIAEGFLKIAVAKTAQAIRLVSIQKGYDVTEYALVSFGGAAGQICCKVAEELGVEKILIHPQAGVLSAYGIGLADRVIHRSQGIYRKLTNAMDLETQFQSLSTEIVQEFDCLDLKARAGTHSVVDFQNKVDVRYTGTESYLTIEFENTDSIASQFEIAHQKRFGFLQQHAIEIGMIRVEGRVGTTSLQKSPRSGERSYVDFQAVETSPISVPNIDRSTLTANDEIMGPMLIFDPLATTYLDHGWRGKLLDDGQLLITNESGLKTVDDCDQANAPTENEAIDNEAIEIDAVQVELFNNQLFSIAEQMGETLRATAVSVNVKERLDFSCAIFDEDGDLIANAPHIPIHLGAMSECVKGIIEDNKSIEPGDVFITNDPYRGGSHLPDVTVITPVFRDNDSLGSSINERQSHPRWSQHELLFWVASRAHHAEMGGITPGSMPPHSKTLGEEGVLIQNFKVLSQTKNRFDELLAILSSGPYPSRQPETNLSDIQAQIAANQKGRKELLNAVQSISEESVTALLNSICELAAEETRRTIRALPKKHFSFEDFLDCGAKIKVQITIVDDTATIDFSGTSATLDNNLNANRAIVLSAIIYIFRLMIGKDIPLNQGILQPVNLILPECFLNPLPSDDHSQSPAVVGGNVETSQRVVDVLMGAFKIAAASQGTSNNVIFGDESFGYYETICGGSGASANQNGADAVQVHITNTRITDPEILETRYPVILDEFRIREGSGGDGIHAGGNGVVRSMRFTKPLTLSVLSNRSKEEFPPFGLNGGKPSSIGSLHKKTDDENNIVGMIIKTPGGGGWENRS